MSTLIRLSNGKRCRQDLANPVGVRSSFCCDICRGTDTDHVGWDATFTSVTLRTGCLSRPAGTSRVNISTATWAGGTFRMKACPQFNLATRCDIGYEQTSYSAVSGLLYSSTAACAGTSESFSRLFMFLLISGTSSSPFFTLAVQLHTATLGSVQIFTISPSGPFTDCDQFAGSYSNGYVIGSATGYGYGGSVTLAPYR